METSILQTSEQILADLIAEGLTGNDLLTELSEIIKTRNGENSYAEFCRSMDEE